MATVVHCLFCFEVLAAKLENSQAPSLAQTQGLWDQYTASQLSDQEMDDDTEDIENEEASEPEEEPIMRSPPLRPRLDHLLVPSPSSASSVSTPSSGSTSTASSRTPVSTLASSSNSSRSSFFSSFALRPGRFLTRTTEPNRPLFVTWTTIDEMGGKSLRGCIGTFEAQELESGLRNYALTSALEDSRFVPITKDELPELEVGVTLLHNFELAPSPYSWELGKHGLRISFTYHDRRLGATYLPDVPVEQGWSKEATLISLMRKAGWTGRKAEWRQVTGLKLVRYQGKKVTMRYDEWITWRRWAERQGSL
ncbi:MAG: hypothetical protein M1816_002589 [Peltula sp. TS41687]|nr:MAG: hypothetical protein M1816_002589 [Peltula sp. TS41687]